MDTQDSEEGVGEAHRTAIPLQPLMKRQAELLEISTGKESHLQPMEDPNGAIHHCKDHSLQKEPTLAGEAHGVPWEGCHVATEEYCEEFSP